MAEAAAAELSTLVERLRPRGDGLRWTDPASWHITLQFLGNTQPEQLVCLLKQLAEVQAAPVAIQLAGLACFERAGVFHVGIEPTPALAALQQRVVAATAHCGFEPETRPFHPHITLARAKGQGGGQQLGDLMTRLRQPPAFSRFTASTFRLYESHLLPRGAEYEILAQFPLAG